MTDLLDLTLSEARDGLRKGLFSAVEMTDAYIQASDSQRHLNAFITETPEQARQHAVEADRALQNGSAAALTGVPIGHKDLFCTKNVRTTAGSRMLESFVPPYESTVSAKLREAGCICLGKLNLDEFAMGASNETSFFGSAQNPWKKTGEPTGLVPGGSSGGSAAAVAARMVLASTGTDTGGSIRQPAAYCGVTGLKPTYGRCSRYGIVAFASSLDQAGPITRTVRDAAIMLTAMAGFDPKDSTSVDRTVPDFETTLTEDIRGLRIGIPQEYRVDGLDTETSHLWDKGIEWLRDAGAEIHDISLPHTSYALATYYIIAPAEASSNLARYDGVRYGLRIEGSSLDDMYAKTRATGFGDEVQRRILMGTYVLSSGYYDAYYLKAQKVRTRISQDFQHAFTNVDAILTPTAPTAAFPLGTKTDDPIAMYLNDVFTVPASLAGLPGLSVPAGLSSSGLPLGLQIIGRPFDEETVLRVGGVLEQAAQFSARPTHVKG